MSESNKFNIEELGRKSFRAALIAPSETGKTYFLLYMLGQLVDYYKIIFLIMPAKNELYTKYIWPNHIFEVQDINEMNDAIMRIVRYGETLKAKNSRNKIIVILDDLGLKTGHPTSKVEVLLTRGRNALISSFILAQSYQMISSNMRCNITHTFIFSPSEEFRYYIKTLPKVEDTAQVLSTISKLFKKGETKYKDKKIVGVLHSVGGKLLYYHTFIDDFDRVKNDNILHKQYSLMMNNDTEIDPDKIII